MSGPERRYRKKALKPAIKRELVSYLAAQFAMSIRQACRTLSLSRTVYFYQPDTRRDETVIMALTELAERYPRIKIGLNISAQRVDRIVANRGYPLKMRLNNGSVLVFLTIAQCAEKHGVALEFIKPGEQHRMRLSNGLTGRTGQKSWIFTCSRH